MKIRKANNKDLKSIAKLLLEYDAYEHSLDKNVKLFSLKEVEKAEKEHMDFGTIYFLAETDKNLLGVLNVNVDRRGKEKIGVLHTLIITKEARRNGIGSKLVKYAFNYFKKKGCSRVRTFIHIANKNALGFWKKQGFHTEEGYTTSRRL
jgi:N-acetylglutamate synthase-like GNAT family acetyltransferase